MQRVVLDNGRIILINGDSLHVLQKVKHEAVDLVCADPPYFNVLREKWDNDWLTLIEYLYWSKQWITAAIPTMKQSSSFYIWGGIGERSDTIIHLKLLIDTLGLHFKDWLTWSKSRGMGNRRGWVYAREECLWYVRDNKRFIWNVEHQYGTERRKRDAGLPLGQMRESMPGYYCKSPYKRLTSVWSDISEQGKDTLNKKTDHYTPKPYAAIERIVKVHTSTQDCVVLDPFLGSGTTGEVCAKLGRRFIGIEKDTHSFNEAVHAITAALESRTSNAT